MLFEAKDVVSGYGALQVLNGVNVSVDEGEIVSVLGANGAGRGRGRGVRCAVCSRNANRSGLLCAFFKTTCP